MSISGSVLRNRAVLLIYLRAVSNSYFTVHCFNSESVFQPWRPHPGLGGGWLPAKGFLSSSRQGKQLYYSKITLCLRGAQAFQPCPPPSPGDCSVICFNNSLRLLPYVTIFPHGRWAFPAVRWKSGEGLLWKPSRLAEFIIPKTPSQADLPGGVMWNCPIGPKEHCPGAKLGSCLHWCKSGVTKRSQ